MSEVFGLNYNEPLGHRPFCDFPGLEVSRTQGLATLRDCIAWMATCGEVDYRLESIPYVRHMFVEAGFRPDALEQYSPMTDEWTPDCAITEKLYLARSRFLALPVLSTSEGQASTAEVPFGFIGGLLRGQRVFTHISPGGELGGRVFIGRALARSYLTAFKEDLRPVAIQNFGTLASLQEGVARSAIEYLQQSPNENASQPIILHRPLLDGRIIITGSGDEDLMNSVLRRFPNQMVTHSGMVSTTYNRSFDQQATMRIAEETQLKTRSAVNLVAISGEQLSYGAVNEIGWLILGSILHNQAVGIYMQRHDSNDKSAANRQRLLTMSHIGRLFQDFPWLTERINVTESTEELSEWGKFKLSEHYRLRKAMGVS